jgi:hypothetical protein
VLSPNYIQSCCKPIRLLLSPILRQCSVRLGRPWNTDPLRSKTWKLRVWASFRPYNYSLLYFRHKYWNSRVSPGCPGSPYHGTTLTMLFHFCLTSSILVCDQSSWDRHPLPMPSAPHWTSVVYLARAWMPAGTCQLSTSGTKTCSNSAFWQMSYNIWVHLPESWPPPAWLPRAHLLLCPVFPHWI